MPATEISPAPPARSVRPVALKQLELDFGAGGKAICTVDLPVELARDGGLQERPRSEMRVEISIRQASEALGLHRDTVRQWVKEGKLRGWRVGRNYRVCALDVQRVRDESEVLGGLR